MGSEVPGFRVQGLIYIYINAYYIILYICVILGFLQAEALWCVGDLDLLMQPCRGVQVLMLSSGREVLSGCDQL